MIVLTILTVALLCGIAGGKLAEMWYQELRGGETRADRER